MKVRAVLSVEADRTEWANEYGTSPSARAVAEDVKGYVINAVQNAAAPIQAAELGR